MTAPLVSVSGFLVSETVSTKQPTLFGAVALCSRGVASRWFIFAVGAPSQGSGARRSGELYADSCPADSCP